MALKFECPNCGSEIIVKRVKVGEMAKCRSCDTELEVPEPENPIELEADSWREIFTTTAIAFAMIAVLFGFIFFLVSGVYQLITRSFHVFLNMVSVDSCLFPIPQTCQV